jgi:hypothetical protein
MTSAFKSKIKRPEILNPYSQSPWQHTPMASSSFYFAPHKPSNLKKKADSVYKIFKTNSYHKLTSGPEKYDLVHASPVKVSKK